jgi:DNA topoisomerase-3
MGAQLAGSHVKVILAEKPSVAREIAGFVGAGARRDSYLEGGGYQVTWAFGHLVELKEPEDYDPALKRWSLRSGSEFDSLYAAAKCRSEADWIVGLNATRNYTVRHGASGVLWSVGRVQTPVLAMIVGRDDEIRTFKIEPFWELMTRYRDVVFKYCGDRFLQNRDAETKLEQVQGHPFVVTKVDRKEERNQPPQLFDLTELQRTMNRRFGLSADTTLKAAQALYEAKLITYPRTDSRYVSSDMKKPIPEIFRQLRAYKPREIDQLNLDALPYTGRIVNDRKVSDHHAIIPVGGLPTSLPSPQEKVFDAVVTRFIAAFYPVCLKEVTTVDGMANEILFRARGVRVVQPGWTELEQPAREKEDDNAQSLPAFTLGETRPHEPFIKQGKTSPPRHFTENTLLGAMETAGKLVEDEQLREALKDKGIGTAATRASIIETLLKRDYIRREKKNLLATDLGRYLIAMVRDRDLKSPELTGQWEAKLRNIEAGKLEPGQFMNEIAEYTARIVRSGEAAAVIDGHRLGNCPRCGSEVIQGNRGYGCSAWKNGCKFVLWPTYKERQLEVSEIRELLQHSVLQRPIELAGVGLARISHTVRDWAGSGRPSALAGSLSARIGF